MTHAERFLFAWYQQRPHQLLGDIPIEAKLRTPATSLMYEVCRVQKLDAADLGQSAL